MKAFRERQEDEERKAAELSRRRGARRGSVVGTTSPIEAKESSGRQEQKPSIALRKQQFTAAPDDSNPEERDAPPDLKLKHLNTSPSTLGKTIRSNNMTKASGTLHHMND